LKSEGKVRGSKLDIREQIEEGETFAQQLQGNKPSLIQLLTTLLQHHLEKL